MKPADVPDEFVFLCPDGMEEIARFHPDTWAKIIIARNVTRWHQSLETTVNRMLKTGLRGMLARHNSQSPSPDPS